MSGFLPKGDNMKKITAVFLLLIICLSFAACTKNPIAEEYGSESIIEVKNAAEEHLSGMALTCYIGDKAIGSIGSEQEDGGELGQGSVSFCVSKDDIPEGADLSDFSIKVSVTDEDGNTADAVQICFPLEFGKDYFFELHSVDGIYSLKEMK